MYNYSREIHLIWLIDWLNNLCSRLELRARQHTWLDRPVISNFIRYVNFDTQKVKEEYLRPWSKGLETLCTKIWEVLVSKHILITRLCFYGLDGTKATSGKLSGFQQMLKHEAPHPVWNSVWTSGKLSNTLLSQLKRPMQHTEENDGPLSKNRNLPFLQLSQQKLELARRLCYNSLSSVT